MQNENKKAEKECGKFGDYKLPALFVFCGSRGVEKLMPVWHWLNILKKWGTSPELF